MNKKELIQQIQNAFQENSYPGDDNIVYDNSPTHLACKEIADSFRGKEWEEIGREGLRYHSDGFFFFTTEAFIYYLPAFMIFVVEDFEESDSIPNAILSSLTAPDLSDSYEKIQAFQKLISHLSSDQKEVIETFLRYLEESYSEEFYDDEIEAAIKSLSITYSNVDLERLRFISLNKKIIDLAWEALKNHVSDSENYVCIKIENQIYTNEPTWLLTFKHKDILNSSRSEITGLGGEIFIEVNLDKEEAILKGYGE